MIPLPPLNLSFADATNQAAQSGAPVIFGAMAFGRGTAGGNSTTANPSLTASGSATAVTPVTTFPSLGGSEGGGGGGLGDFLPLATSTLPFIESTMGLNGGMVQDPKATLALYNQLPTGVKQNQVVGAAPASFLPGPVAIGAGILALAFGAWFLLR